MRRPSLLFYLDGSPSPPPNFEGVVVFSFANKHFSLSCGRLVDFLSRIPLLEDYFLFRFLLKLGFFFSWPWRWINASQRRFAVVLYWFTRSYDLLEGLPLGEDFLFSTFTMRLSVSFPSSPSFSHALLPFFPFPTKTLLFF